MNTRQPYAEQVFVNVTLPFFLLCLLKEKESNGSTRIHGNLSGRTIKFLHLSFHSLFVHTPPASVPAKHCKCCCSLLFIFFFKWRSPVFLLLHRGHCGSSLWAPIFTPTIWHVLNRFYLEHKPVKSVSSINMIKRNLSRQTHSVTTHTGHQLSIIVVIASEVDVTALLTSEACSGGALPAPRDHKRELPTSEVSVDQKQCASYLRGPHTTQRSRSVLLLTKV